MKYLNIYKNSSKTAFSGLLCAGVLSASFSAQAADVTQIQEPAQQPLQLIEGVSPNILFTVDDSGSMAWAFTPDNIYGNSDRRAARSSHYNAQYYDPGVVYKVPKKISLVDGQAVAVDYPVPSFTNAPTDGFAGTDKVNLSTHYVAQWYYDGYSDGWLDCLDNCATGWNSYTNRGGRDYLRSSAYYYNYTCAAGTTSTSNSCYTHKTVTTTDQKKNFAIWYSFYRNRLLATKSAASLAFYKIPESMRFTWGAINTCDIGSNKSSCGYNTFDNFKAGHKVRFHTWLDALDWTGSTPSHQAMIRAGELMKKKSSYSTDSQGTPYSCQASYHVFMTDGMWNQRPDSDKLVGNADYNNITLPDGSLYNRSSNLSKPYSDSQNDTLADIAFYYWATDLINAGNEVKSKIFFPSANKTEEYWDPRNNPATWQHLVNFTVGLGLSNSLTSSSFPTWDGSNPAPTFANIDELKNLGSNGKNWPEVSDNNNNNVYDLWHAAINSRGEFFSADSPDSLIQAFEKVIASINARSATASSPAINSGVGDDGTGYSYQASYDADQNWAGNLTASKTVLDMTGNASTTEIWNARAELAKLGADSRNIKMVQGKNLVNFAWGNLTAPQKDFLNRDPDDGNAAEIAPAPQLGSARLSFLRGDRSQEDAAFRKRDTVLGDIVNSKPVTVRGARYLAGNANRIEGVASKYEEFVTQQKAHEPMVYVGANDGMLHGFNANTGVENFAFVPSAVFKNLNQLTGKSYGAGKHQFYVDGSPVVADVFINKKWRTVLVGTLGAGGKGMFALDVTDPTAITLLWEFNEDKLATAAAKLGYTYSQPTIARLDNGKWAAVVGNGYAATDSTNGKASLLIIDMETGNLTANLVVDGVSDVPNGMSTPKLADINGDGIADFAYAGDLQGSLWRFDLASPTWKVSFNKKPLFVAKDANGNRQSISAAPSIVRHPSGNGYIIVAGTGRYYAEGDKNGLAGSTQTIYGVWDPTTKGGTPFADITRAKLQEQEMEKVLTAVDSGKEARSLSNRAVSWAVKDATGNLSLAGGKKAGWYFDLALDKEMIVADMLQFGQTLYFQSLVPDADPCKSGVDNWSYAINPATGGRTLHHAWTDYRNSDDPSVPVTAVKMDGDGGLSIGQRPDKKFQLCTGVECEEITPDPSSIGRQSWRAVGGQ